MIFSETDPVANSAGGGGAGGGISLCDYRPIISSNMFMIPANHHQFTPDTVAAAAAPPFMAAHHQNKFMGYPPGLSLGQPWFMNQPSMADVCFESVDSGAVGVREDELDSKSVGSDNAEGAVCGSGEDHEGGERRPRKKRYHRHTQHQIQEMEMFFKECPHPDDKQRKELSRELRLDPLQVKFWFQNKRTQMKTQLERMENSQLKAENEKLMAENMRYKEALSHASCPNCGGPSAMGEISFDEHQLRLENARLRQEIDRISGIAVKHVGKPLHSLSSGISRSGGLDLGMDVGRGCSEMFGVNSANVSASSGIGDRCLAPGFAPTEMEKPVVMELAVEAMEEFIKLAHMGSPLWNFSTHTDSSTAVEILNENEYARSFPACGIIGPRPYGFRAEASRASGAVMLDAITLVETLMDVNRWLTTFPDIISRANSVDDMPTGVAGNYNGALQVMFAEFQLPTPLVPAREYYFARYCKQHSEGVWAVVDVSLDLDSLRLSVPSSMNRCRRRPSGLLIQHVSNGCSKVTWVEHVEVEERETKEIYRYLVNSGMAFGAKRWLATLQRQSERMTTKISTMELSVIPSEDGRKRMMKLAERMVISFCEGAGASTAGQTWTPLAGAADDDDDFVRIMTRKSVDDPGRPPGIVLSAATSFWLPLPHLAVFDFLRNSSTRNEWDILANGAMVQEIAHIVTGQQPGNSVSLMRVNNVTPNQSSSSNNNNMLILQESSRHECGCMVIYAPVYVAAMNAVLRGGDPDLVALLPSGFALVPDHSRTAGSLLTVAFQILVDPQPSANLSLASIATVNKLISCTVQQIRSALLGLSDKVINSV